MQAVPRMNTVGTRRVSHLAIDLPQSHALTYTYTYTYTYTRTYTGMYICIEQAVNTFEHF